MSTVHLLFGSEPPRLTPEWAEVVRMLAIKRRVPFHLQRGHRSCVFVSGGKTVEPATEAEIAEYLAWEDGREPK